MTTRDWMHDWNDPLHDLPYDVREAAATESLNQLIFEPVDLQGSSLASFMSYFEKHWIGYGFYRLKVHGDIYFDHAMSWDDHVWEDVQFVLNPRHRGLLHCRLNLLDKIRGECLTNGQVWQSRSPTEPEFDYHPEDQPATFMRFSSSIAIQVLTRRLMCHAVAGSPSMVGSPEKALELQQLSKSILHSVVGDVDFDVVGWDEDTSKHEFYLSTDPIVPWYSYYLHNVSIFFIFHKESKEVTLLAFANLGN